MSVKWMVVQLIGDTLRLPMTTESDVNMPLGSARIGREVKRIVLNPLSDKPQVFEPERGECHEVIGDNLDVSEGMGDAWANCSECGALLYVLTDTGSMRPNYCPMCGRMVSKA